MCSQHDVAKYVARSNGERNSAARIFRSSCSRSLEIASGHYGRLLTSLPTSIGPQFCSFFLSLSFFFFFLSSDSIFPSLLRFLSLCPSTFCTFPFLVLRLCRFLSIRSRLFYPSPRYQSRGLTGMRRSGVARLSPTHLHVCPVVIHAHLAHVYTRSTRLTQTLLERWAKKIAEWCPAARILTTIFACRVLVFVESRGAAVGVSRANLYEDRWLSSGHLAWNRRKWRSLLSFDYRLDAFEWPTSRDRGGLMIRKRAMQTWHQDCRWHTVIGGCMPTVLRSRARARVHAHPHTHARTGDLERSSEALPTSTFVFRLRTGGRRETSWLSPTPFYLETPLFSIEFFIVGSLSGLWWCHCIYLLDRQHVVIHEVAEIMLKKMDILRFDFT